MYGTRDDRVNEDEQELKRQAKFDNGSGPLRHRRPGLPLVQSTLCSSLCWTLLSSLPTQYRRALSPSIARDALEVETKGSDSVS